MIPITPDSPNGSSHGLNPFTMGGVLAVWKCCSRCGKIHTQGFTCHAGKRIYRGGSERTLRSTYKWTEKSKDIRDKAHYLCEVCKAEGRLTYDGVEVHHITKVKDNTDLLLDDYNLICLCAAHHHAADHNQIDKEYLLSLARQRENDFKNVQGAL